MRDESMQTTRAEDAGEESCQELRGKAAWPYFD